MRKIEVKLLKETETAAVVLIGCTVKVLSKDGRLYKLIQNLREHSDKSFA